MSHLDQVFGRPEINIFKREFLFQGESEAIKTQFAGVDFISGGPTAYTYSKTFDPDDVSQSLYNFTTVKRLFEIGYEVDEARTSTSIDTTKFNQLSGNLHLNKNEMYVAFKWLQHIANTTYLQIQDDEDLPLHQSRTDKAAFGVHTPNLFQSEIESFIIDFSSEYIGRAMAKYFEMDSCVTVVNRIFPDKDSGQL